MSIVVVVTTKKMSGVRRIKTAGRGRKKVAKTVMEYPPEFSSDEGDDSENDNSYELGDEEFENDGFVVNKKGNITVNDIENEKKAFEELRKICRHLRKGRIVKVNGKLVCKNGGAC